MQGAIVSEYFGKQLGISSKDMFTVAITPCTSKKFEVSRKELPGTDAVITTKELIELIKLQEIDFKSLEDSDFDNILGEGSGAGMIFGSTGGVMEASLRTVYKILTNNNLPNDKLVYNEVRGLSNVKELSLEINGITLNVAVVNQMSSAIPLLEDVKNGKSKYHYIEIMNCLGGCIGGGGQPKSGNGNEIKVKQKRMDSLYARDDANKIRFSHQNPCVVKLYEEFLGEPLSNTAEKLLHTRYINRSNELKK